MRLLPPARVLLALLACALVAATAPSVARAAGGPTPTERALLVAINEARAQHGLRPLRLGWPLQRRAHEYARVILARDRFAHATLPRGIRENLALGRIGPRRVVRLWLNSPAHRSALLWPRARRVGVGMARGRFGGYSRIRVAVARFTR